MSPEDLTSLLLWTNTIQAEHAQLTREREKLVLAHSLLEIERDLWMARYTKLKELEDTERGER